MPPFNAVFCKFYYWAPKTAGKFVYYMTQPADKKQFTIDSLRLLYIYSTVYNPS